MDNKGNNMALTISEIEIRKNIFNSCPAYVNL